MNSKQAILLSVTILSASLSSCIVPHSPTPVGDSFKRTGDAIGNVVNGVANAVKPKPKQQPQAQPQNYPQPRPYQTPQQDPNYSLPQ